MGLSGHDRRCRKHWRSWGSGLRTRFPVVVIGARPSGFGSSRRVTSRGYRSRWWRGTTTWTPTCCSPGGSATASGLPGPGTAGLVPVVVEPAGPPAAPTGSATGSGPSAGPPCHYPRDERRELQAPPSARQGQAKTRPTGELRHREKQQGLSRRRQIGRPALTLTACGDRLPGCFTSAGRDGDTAVALPVAPRQSNPKAACSPCRPGESSPRRISS